MVARLEVHGPAPAAQVAARLWDVTRAGRGARASQALVARGLYRPSRDGRAVFQLNANVYAIQPGHAVRLELLASDAPFARAPVPTVATTVSDLELRLPTLEPPGAGPVSHPSPPVVPAGARLAPGYRATGR